MSLYKFNATAKFAFVQNNIIQSHLPWNDWQQIGLGEILLKIDVLDYSEKTAMATARLHPTTAWQRATTMAAAVVSATETRATGAARRAMGTGTDYDEFWDLWHKNKKIPGGIYLSPNSKLIFVSCIDLKYFTKL